MPRLKQIAAERLAREVVFREGGTRMSDTPWDESGLNVDYPFAWQLLGCLGAFPAPMDRHITEFFPHMFRGEESYYGRTLGVDAFPFEAVVELGDRVYREMEERTSSADPLPKDYFDQISGEHEQILEIIESIRCDSGRRYSANFPNHGQVPNLPPEMIVECPVLADGGGLRPIMTPPFDSGLAGTLAIQGEWVEAVVDAALLGSREKFVQALLLDGAIDSIESAEQLANDLLQAQAEYLPRFAAHTTKKP